MANKLLALKDKISYPFGFSELYEIRENTIVCPSLSDFSSVWNPQLLCYKFYQVEPNVFWDIVGCLVTWEEEYGKGRMAERKE